MNYHLLIMDVKLGIGTNKYVLNALKDGNSMLMDNAFLLMKTVKVLIDMEVVLNATKDM